MTGKAEQTVIFLHIPKTAGTTLHRIIERHYPPEHVFSLGPMAQESIREFKNLSEARRAEIRMLKGHMGFGLHEFVPGPSTYFTLLREPIDRVISFYYFVCRTHQHYLYDFVQSGHIGLKDFVESHATFMVDNAQTRMLSGVWLEVGFGECTKETLEQAKRNLRESFTVVSLTEKFDETLVLLRRAFGWEKLFYTRQNVTANRPQKSDLSSDTLDTLADVNQLDIELYQYATELFEEQVRQQGLSFVEEVKAFQLANHLNNPSDNLLVKAYWEMRKYSVRALIRKWTQRILD
jgi:hypothetical protein